MGLTREIRLSHRLRLLVGVLNILGLACLARFNLPSEMLLAADGVSYQRSIAALLNDGPFSNYPGLFFQPSGYPLLIWGVSFFGLFPTSLTVVLLQGSIHVLSIMFLSKRLEKTGFARVVPFLFLFLMFNPILCLSAMNCGYESLASSFIIITVTLLLTNKKCELKELVIITTLQALLILMNTRFIAVAVLVFIYIYSRSYFKRLRPQVILLGSVCVLLPIFLLTARNEIAVGVMSPSTNLGVTLNLGACLKATGAHNIYGEFGVTCEELTGSPSLVIGSDQVAATFFNFTEINTPATVSKYDTILRNCVIKWYMDNPRELIRLFFNKTVFFFSPFTGSLSTGTFEINNSLISSINANVDGLSSNAGQFGTTPIIYATFILGLAFLFLVGVQRAYRLNFEVTSLLLALAASQWLISAVTIGDNRFRIPVIPLITLFAAYGLTVLLEKKSPSTDAQSK